MKDVALISNTLVIVDKHVEALGIKDLVELLGTNLGLGPGQVCSHIGTSRLILEDARSDARGAREATSWRCSLAEMQEAWSPRYRTR